MKNLTVVLMISLGVFLVLFPLGIYNPGIPATLGNDEPCYYMATLSLLHDGDVRFEPQDLERVFNGFPYGFPNLIVMSRDGWKTVYFGKPYLYSLLAAPFYALFGLNGFWGFNAILFVVMIYMGWAYLARYNSSSVAALFAFSFFYLSAGARYIFWLQPEVLGMACTAAALFFSFYPFAPGAVPRGVSRLLNEKTGLLLAMLPLGIAASIKPTNLAVALPIFGAALLRRSFGRTALAALSLAAVMGAVMLGQFAMTGQYSAYIGASRLGLSISRNDFAGVVGQAVEAERRAAPPVPNEQPAEGGSSYRNDWSWLAESWRDFELGRAANDVKYYLVGRHIGIIPYLPFALISFLLFVRWNRNDAARWLIPASLAIYAVFFIIAVPHNYHGGSGFIGNRYFIMVYPAMLFAVTTVRPLWTFPVGWAMAGLFVAQLLFTPFGAPTAFAPTQQVHARNFPFRWLPFEINLRRQIPGFEGTGMGDAYFVFRGDQGWGEPGGLWLRGGVKADVLVLAEDPPLEKVYFAVTNRVSGNRCSLRFGGRRARVDFAPGKDYKEQIRIVAFDGPRPAARETFPAKARDYWLTVKTDRGFRPDWLGDGSTDRRYLGCRIMYLGRAEHLEADLYRPEWDIRGVPDRAAPGQEIRTTVQVRNASRFEWPPPGLTRLAIRARWKKDGASLISRAFETEPPRLKPGARWPEPVDAVLKAPDEPGEYSLMFDMGLKPLWWFSDRDPATRKTFKITVAADAAAVVPGAQSGAQEARESK